ncbi:unnamed protein product [Protopolystoma xenopodis]|uniref:Uncharacterized protein n=1 Tax=Protopolystoma xenopodis TaxID=117903 RepID=A0A3S5AMG7_9PLAT|nr:unnamed protein product [Protopolystoma xenopodis]
MFPSNNPSASSSTTAATCVTDSVCVTRLFGDAPCSAVDASSKSASCVVDSDMDWLRWKIHLMPTSIPFQKTSSSCPTYREARTELTRYDNELLETDTLPSLMETIFLESFASHFGEIQSCLHRPNRNAEVESHMKLAYSSTLKRLIGLVGTVIFRN